MRFIGAIVCTAFGAALALATDAPVVTNPAGAHYLAIAPGSGSAGNQAIVMQVSVETPTNATKGALVTVNMNGPVIPGGPFIYGINNMLVATNATCSSTNDHLDPYNRGINPPCDASQPQTCEIGDLSGKHGNIPTLPGFSTQYIDNYLSLVSGTPAFIGNRSLVLYTNNGTAIACANFVAANGSSNGTVATGGVSSTGVGYFPALTGAPNTTTSTAVVTPTGGAGGISGTSTSTSTAAATATVSGVAAVHDTGSPLTKLVYLAAIVLGFIEGAGLRNDL